MRRISDTDLEIFFTRVSFDAKASYIGGGRSNSTTQNYAHERRPGKRLKANVNYDENHTHTLKLHLVKTEN